MAKTQNFSVSKSRFAGFRIQSLHEFVGSDKDEMYLFLVLAIKQYLSKTCPLRPTCSRLFMSTESKKEEKREREREREIEREISRDTIFLAEEGHQLHVQIHT